MTNTKPQPENHNQAMFAMVAWLYCCVIVALFIAVCVKLVDFYADARMESLQNGIKLKQFENQLLELGNKAAASPQLLEADESILPRKIEDILKDNLPAGLQATPAAPAPAPTPQATLLPANTSAKKASTGNAAVDDLVLQARSAQISGDLRLAMSKLVSAEKIAPKEAVVLFYLAEVYEALLNTAKAREYYTKVFQLRDAAGEFYPKAAHRLENGFQQAGEMVGELAFGNIREYRDPETQTGQRVVLTIPVLLKPGSSVRAEDIFIPIQFYDKVNGKRVEPTRAEAPKIRWTSEPVDWADGEETLEIRYFLPPLNAREILAFGDLSYYGYTAKLFYKNAPMDCAASPKALLLHNLKEQQAEQPIGEDGLLPPLEAEKMSDNMLPPL